MKELDLNTLNKFIKVSKMALEDLGLVPGRVLCVSDMTVLYRDFKGDYNDGRHYYAEATYVEQFGFVLSVNTIFLNITDEESVAKLMSFEP